MRGHDNARLATGRRSKCFTSRSKLHAARQQRDWNRWLELLHHPANGFGMLLGQHLSRGNKHGLIAGVYGLEHGSERHYGFAGADFALQQTLHGPVTFKIGRDVVHHLTLPGCQCERQRCDEAVAQIGQIGQIRQIGRRTALRCFWLRTWLRNRFAHRRSSCFQRLVQRARMRR